MYFHTDPITNILDYKPWFIKQDNAWIALNCDDQQYRGNDILIHVAGYDSPEHAKQLTGLEVAITREQLPKLPKGEFYWHDLIGLEVLTTDKKVLGVIRQIIHSGAHPILDIEGDKKHLVPFVMDKFIHDINLDEQKIIVDWDPEF